VQEGGVFDKDLNIYYWKDIDDLEKQIKKIIIRDLTKETDSEKRFIAHMIYGRHIVEKIQNILMQVFYRFYHPIVMTITELIT